MKIIASYNVEFKTAEDVQDYISSEPIDIPENDYIVDDAIDFKVGYRNVVVIFADRVVIRDRKRLVGLAVDGDPIILHGPEFRRMQDELVTDWDEWDLDRRARLRAAYNELGYKKFFKDHAHTRADYEFMYKSDEQIHRDNVDAAKALIIDLCYRVREITGDITDWSGVMAEIGTHGLPVLNGYIVGKQGRARVESILAGGYNIQRLHVRVLVHEINW